MFSPIEYLGRGLKNFKIIDFRFHLRGGIALLLLIAVSNFSRLGQKIVFFILTKFSPKLRPQEAAPNLANILQ